MVPQWHKQFLYCSQNTNTMSRLSAFLSSPSKLFCACTKGETPPESGSQTHRGHRDLLQLRHHPALWSTTILNHALFKRAVPGAAALRLICMATNTATSMKWARLPWLAGMACCQIGKRGRHCLKCSAGTAADWSQMPKRMDGEKDGGGVNKGKTKRGKSRRKDLYDMQDVFF